MQVQLQQIVVPPGQQLIMTDVSWLMYEQLLDYKTLLDAENTKKE